MANMTMAEMMANMTHAERHEFLNTAKRAAQAADANAKAKAKGEAERKQARNYGGMAADHAGPGRYAAGKRKGERTIAQPSEGESGIRGGYFAGLMPVETAPQPIGRALARGFIPKKSAACASCGELVLGSVDANEQAHAGCDPDPIQGELTLGKLVHTPHWLRVEEIAEALGLSARTDRWSAFHVACLDAAERDYRVAAAAGHFGDDERARVEGFAQKATASAERAQRAIVPPAKTRPRVDVPQAPALGTDAALAAMVAENERLRAALATREAPAVAAPVAVVAPIRTRKRPETIGQGLEALAVIAPTPSA